MPTRLSSERPKRSGSPHLSNGSWSVFWIVLPVEAKYFPLPQARLIHEADIFSAVLTRDFVELAVVGLAIVILESEIAGRTTAPELIYLYCMILRRRPLCLWHRK